MSPKHQRYRIILTAALPALALWSMLASQGASFLSFAVPPVSYGWVVLAAFAALWLVGRERDLTASRRSKLVGTGLALSFLVLSVWRHALLVPSVDLELTLEDGRTARADSLQLPERRHIRRVTGERRNVAFEARAVVDVPVEGDYRFDLFCDDACTVDIGPHRLEARGRLSRTVALERGPLPFRLRYRQTTGPAALLVSWNTPRAVELLPIEHYLRTERTATAPARRTASVVVLALLVVWWIGFTLASFELAPLARSRYVPIVAAAIVGIYGGALRVEAFLAHSRLAETHETAARWHGRILPVTPPYAVFNPDNAPDDPYRADVRSYLDRAEAMDSLGSFYGPSFREPLHVALTKPFLALAGGERGILVQSLFFSLLTLPLVYVVTYRRYGAWWALAVLVPVALHQWLVLEAPTGYRMSAYGFVLVAFVAAVSFSRSPVVAGILGGAITLIRLSALAVVAPVLLIKVLGLVPEERRRYAGVAVGLVLLLVVPFLWSNYRAHGDPFYAVSFHTEFWLRAEGLSERASGPVGLMQYFTDFGRGFAVAKGTFLGMTVLPLRTFWNGLAEFPLLALAVVGAGLVGLVASRGIVLLAYLGQLFPFAYIQNFPSGEMPRFVMPAFLMLALAVPAGARALLGVGARFRTRISDIVARSHEGKRTGGEP